MSTAYTTQALVLPAPVYGMNTKDPLAKMDPAYTPWLCNADCEYQKIKSRGGYILHATATGGADIMALASYGGSDNATLFAYTREEGAQAPLVLNVTTSTPSTAFTDANNAQIQSKPIYFNSRLVFLNSGVFAYSVGGPGFDGTTWAEWGETFSGGGDIYLTPYAYFKGQGFFVDYDGILKWSDVGQVTGALPAANTYDLYKQWSNLKHTAWIGSFSMADGLVNQQYIAFGNYSGEVIVFQGDNPNLSTWSIVGKYTIGKPVGFYSVSHARPEGTSVIQMGNDCLVVTFEGLVSLRDLMEKGNQLALKESITDPIADYWTRIMSGFSEGTATPSAGWVSGIFATRQRKLYILARGFIDDAGAYDSTASTMLVCNVDVPGGWSVHKIVKASAGTGANAWGPGNLCYHNNEVYLSVDEFIYKLDDDYISDEITSGVFQGFDIEIDGAPNNFGEFTSKKKVVGFQPLLYQDLPSGNVEISLMVDLGRVESGADNPILETGYSMQVFSVGEAGTYFQYRLRAETYDGVTETGTGLEFFAINTLWEKGGIL